MDMNESNRRYAKRVKYDFTVRFRSVGSPGSAAWNISILRDISTAGVLFYSLDYYDCDMPLELRIKSPFISEEMICFGNVMRCEQLKNKKGVFAVGVKIAEISPEYRSVYNKTVAYFLDKSNDQDKSL